MKLDKMTLEQLANERDKANKRATIGTLATLGSMGGGILAGALTDNVNLYGAGMTLGTGSALYAGYQDNKAKKLSNKITDKEVQEGVIYLSPKDKHKSGAYINMKDVPKVIYAVTGEATERTLPKSYLLWKKQQDYLKNVDSSMDRSKMTIEELEDLKKKHMRKLRTGKLMNVVGATAVGTGLLGAKSIIEPKGHKVLMSKPGSDGVTTELGVKSLADLGALAGGAGLIGAGMTKTALNRNALKYDNLAIDALKLKSAKNSPEVDFENLV